MTIPVLIENDGPVLRITFNRPDRLNAVTTEMLTRAADAIEGAWDGTATRVIVLTGAGRAFSSGADLGNSKKDPETATIDAANRLTAAVRQVPKPVLAAVNGLAAGVGCSFAIAADITVARESAYFLLAFANVGLMPDGGATALIPAAVGRARASRMAMLAERIAAPLALEWGLISHVARDETFESEVRAVTSQLAEGPTASYAETKQALNAASLGELDRSFEIERAGQARLFGSDDFAEGVAAFRAKRRPRFSGK